MTVQWEKQLTMLSIRQDDPFVLNGYRVPDDLELPIFTEMIGKLKGNDVPWLDFVNGTLYLLANNPDHPRKEDYRQFLFAYDPHIMENLLQQSAVQAKEGNYYLSVNLLYALTAIAPEMPEAYFNLGLSLQNLAQQSQGSGAGQQRVSLYLDGARKAFERAVELKNDFTYAYYFLGFLYQYAGETEEARKAWRKCLQLNPEQPYAEEVSKLLQALPQRRSE